MLGFGITSLDSDFLRSFQQRVELLRLILLWFLGGVNTESSSLSLLKGFRQGLCFLGPKVFRLGFFWPLWFFLLWLRSSICSLELGYGVMVDVFVQSSVLSGGRQPWWTRDLLDQRLFRVIWQSGKSGLWIDYLWWLWWRIYCFGGSFSTVIDTHSTSSKGKRSSFFSWWWAQGGLTRYVWWWLYGFDGNLALISSLHIWLLGFERR